MNRPLLRKRRTREHVIADLSVNYVERQVLLCGHTVDRVRADYGYDLFMFNYTSDGEIQPGHLRFQLKATDSLVVTKNQHAVVARISRSDLLLWTVEQMPVILVVYDAQMEIAYWLYVQWHFEQLGGFNPFVAGKTVSLHIPKTNVLNHDAVSQFSSFRAHMQNQRGEIRHDRGEDR